MRVVLLADIHANLSALEAVLAAIEQLPGVDQIIAAGDYLTQGPQPAATLRRLRRVGAVLIQGNGDAYFGALRRGALAGWQTGRHWAATRWAYERLNEDDLAFVAALPEQRVVTLPGAAAIRVVHGSPQSITGVLVPERDPEVVAQFRRSGLLSDEWQPDPLDEQLQGVSEPVLVCGHTHIQWQQRWAGGLALNPGSVGAPLNGDTRAQYALLAWDGAAWQVEPRRVPYDLGRARAAFQESGFLDSGGFARACLRNVETAQNYTGRFVTFAYALATQMGHPGAGVLPDEVWEQAAATFRWDELG